MSIPVPRNRTYEAFVANLDAARAMARAGGNLEGLGAQNVDIRDLYRSAWLQAISALDRYMNEEIRRRIEAIVLNGYSGTAVSSDTAEAPDELDASRPLTAPEVIRRSVAKTFKRATIQDPEQIKEYVGYIAEGDPWPQIAECISEHWPERGSVDARELKQRLRLIVARRNRIAHHADLRDDDSGLKGDINAADAHEAIDLIGGIVLALNVVLGDVPEAVPDSQPAQAVNRRPNSVWLINEAGAIPEGTVLEFTSHFPHQEQAVGAWVAAVPARGVATWVGGSWPLRWAVDDEVYSPTGLVRKIYTEAGVEAPNSLQGTLNWVVPEQGSLALIAESLYYTQ